jgi:toluene monooxygenase electron transfer component
MQVRVNARNRGFEFQCAADEKVLHAGLRAGVDLPYECATGTCGTCKAKVIAGRVRDAWPEAPGRKYVKPQANECLMCQSVAESDLTLEVAKFVNPPQPGVPLPRRAAARLGATARLTVDVTQFAVELEEPCEFDAGQFMLVAAPGVAGARAYSMVNCERGARRLEFVVKRKPGGAFSEWLASQAQPAAPLALFGPLGKATYYPGLEKNVLCIAGGSGIAGMMSILARAVEARAFERHQGWLFFGVRTLQDAFYLRELTDLGARCGGRLSLTVALSDEPVPERAGRDWPQLAFAHGLVHEVAKAAMAGRYANVRAYIAGPPPAVDAALRVLLLDGKLTTDNIRYDKFS